MLITALSYFLFSAVAGKLVGAFFANAFAMYEILTVIIFVALALFFFPIPKQYATGVFVMAVVALAGIGILAPYSGLIAKLIAGAMSIMVWVMVNRFVSRIIRENGETMSTLGKVVLWLL